MIAISSSSARIFPSLKAYTEKLELARKKDKELTAAKQKAQSSIQEWRDCLELYLDCEYMTRASEVLEDVNLDNLILDSWSSVFEITFKGILNAIACNDPLVIIQ